MPTLQENKERFIDLCQTHIKREGLDQLLDWLDKSDFYTAPASSKYHCCHEGGLLEHSLNVYDALHQLSELFVLPEPIPEESLAISALLHDLCKVNFYKQDTRNVKKDGVWTAVPFYTIDERFVYGGHGSKSVFLAERFIKLTLDEAVAINCHMGASDGNKDVFRAYETCPLAYLLNMADGVATFLMETRGE